MRHIFLAAIAASLLATISHAEGKREDASSADMILQDIGQECREIVEEKGSTGGAGEIGEELLASDDPALRKCGAAALPGEREEVCQKLYGFWMSDADAGVRKTAGIRFITLECEPHIFRSEKYVMDSKTCGYTQFFINSIRDAVVKGEAGRDWKSDIVSMNIKETISDEGVPEEILNMRLNLVFAALDWGETVALMRTADDYGSVEKNMAGHIELRQKYRFKQEYFKQFCPAVHFPDFAYWNTFIGKK